MTTDVVMFISLYGYKVFNCLLRIIHLFTLYDQKVRASKKSISSKRHKDVNRPFTTCYQHFVSFYLDIGDISLF